MYISNRIRSFWNKCVLNLFSYSVFCIQCTSPPPPLHINPFLYRENFQLFSSKSALLAVSSSWIVRALAKPNQTRVAERDCRRNFKGPLILWKACSIHNSIHIRYVWSRISKIDSFKLWFFYKSDMRISASKTTKEIVRINL